MKNARIKKYRTVLIMTQYKVFLAPTTIKKIITIKLSYFNMINKSFYI